MHTNASVDVYLPHEHMWTEGRIVACPAIDTWIVHTDAWIDDADKRTRHVMVTDPHHLHLRGRFCRFDWRAFLRTSEGAGLYVDVCAGSSLYFVMAKVLRHEASTDTILVRTTDGDCVWLPLQSPRVRFLWEWD